MRAPVPGSRPGRRDDRSETPAAHSESLSTMVLIPVETPCAPQFLPGCALMRTILSPIGRTAWLRRSDAGRDRINAAPRLYPALGSGTVIREHSRQRFGRSRSIVEQRLYGGLSRP